MTPGLPPSCPRQKPLAACARPPGTGCRDRGLPPRLRRDAQGRGGPASGRRHTRRPPARTIRWGSDSATGAAPPARRWSAAASPQKRQRWPARDRSYLRPRRTPNPDHRAPTPGAGGAAASRDHRGPVRCCLLPYRFLVHVLHDLRLPALTQRDGATEIEERHAGQDSIRPVNPSSLVLITLGSMTGPPTPGTMDTDPAPIGAAQATDASRASSKSVAAGQPTSGQPDVFSAMSNSRGACPPRRRCVTRPSHAWHGI